MISVFDLFKIGIGPSSSHTIGPMKAAAAFAGSLAAGGQLPGIARVRVDLLGSLAWTGRGHGSDKAVMLGLAGMVPDTLDPDEAERLTVALREDHLLRLAGSHAVSFDPARDIMFDTESATPIHPNTMDFLAFDAAGALVLQERWYSVGGGFVLRDGEVLAEADVEVPYPFPSGAELLSIGRATGLSDRRDRAGERAGAAPGRGRERAFSTGSRRR